MVSRKQSDKNIRGLLAEVGLGGWTVEDPVGNSNIYKAKCHCGNHMEHIHSTPRQNYAKNKLANIKRTCWREGS